jgi:signal peptidase I
MNELMATATATAIGEAQKHEGIKDTIESIVVALILAFVFRAFVVEAFVIPTGSMAPTLYGAHGTILCEACGTEFAYGVRDLDDTRPVTPVRTTASAICPNCNHANSRLPISDEQGNAEKGDRILVLKWPFDLGGPMLDPARWDVIVFKDPADGTTNFIKRCAGLPNEVLMILDGDVYTAPTRELSPETLAELDRNRHEKYEFTTEERRPGASAPLSAAVYDELDRKLRITRRTHVAQQPLWFTVYDHDYPPQKLEDNQPRWAAGLGKASGWEAVSRRVRFQNRGTAADYIELAHKEILAACAYNIHAGRAPWVSDQRVRFVLTPGGTDGRVLIRLSKLGRSFWGAVGMDGSVALHESNEMPAGAAGVKISRQLPPFTPGKAVEISFENLDYRLLLSVGGEEVLASSSDPESPDYYGPNVKALRQMRKETPGSPPRIYAEGGDFELTHLGVDRDEYYFHDTTHAALPTLPWAPRGGWGGRESPILLREHEYFMLGDNTSASKDSRLWDVVGPHLKDRGEAFQLGTVPRDQLIGKAFFVYWPSGHRLDWLPMFSRWGVVPDVGRMRWIR